MFRYVKNKQENFQDQVNDYVTEDNSKINWIYQFIIVKGTEECIDTSYKEFTRSSTLVSNLLIIPHSRIFFCFIVPQTEKSQQKIIIKRLQKNWITFKATQRKKKSSKEYDVACFQRLTWLQS